MDYTTYRELLQCITATSSAKKRKVDNDIERRAFNPAWKEKYFFMDRFGWPSASYA